MRDEVREESRVTGGEAGLESLSGIGSQQRVLKLQRRLIYVLQDHSDCSVCKDEGEVVVKGRPQKRQMQ